jgi:hypothetical protein
MEAKIDDGWMIRYGRYLIALWCASLGIRFMDGKAK